jgi:aspartate aminotransferase-like enzyme
MTGFGTFFLPGPTEVRSEVLHAMTRPLIGHRGSELAAMLREADPLLRAIFRTARPVYVASASATLLMEAAVRNGVRRRALCAGQRRLQRALPRPRARLRPRGGDVRGPWGEAHDPAEVERRLRAGGFDAVTVVHSETSTGVLNPLGEIAEAVRAAETATGEEILLLVDGVTSVGGCSSEPMPGGSTSS